MPYNQDNFAYVLPGGQITLTAFFQTYAGSGLEQPVSGVEITITPVNGGTAVYGPTSDGITAADEATYSLQWQPPVSTAAGDYTVTWTSTSPALTIKQAVTVVALPAESPAPGVYATVAQYRLRSGDQFTAVARVQQLLIVATECIDEALIGAVYPTDADSMPTNPAHIDLFMRATVAQASFLGSLNDPDFVKSQYSSTSMGGVSLTRTGGAQSQVMPPLAPRAAQILHTGGALATAPLINWLASHDGARQHHADRLPRHGRQRLGRQDQRRHPALHRHPGRGSRVGQAGVRPRVPAVPDHPHQHLRRPRGR
jgi:hypothetical protein